MDNRSQISLKELLSLIKRGIEAAHPFAYWVVAEVSEIKTNYSGHCYMELIEKPEGNNTPLAQARAVIWRNKYAMIAPYFLSVTGGDLSAGMKVLVKVAVQYSEIYGLSLQITDIDPTYTIGDSERARRQTIEQLKKDGIFDMNRECELPDFIGRIAVISSKNAAGFEDFIQEIASKGWNIESTVFEAFVQGAGAEESIIGAMESVAERYEDFDAVVIIRGGGSSSDLSCFDSYRLCSHIAQFPLPIITGIGHNKDVSVADMVARLSLKTPTAVALFLNDMASQADRMVNELRSRIEALTTAIIKSKKEHIISSATTLNLSVAHSLNRSTAALQRYGSQMSVAAMSQTRALKGKLEGLKSMIKSSCERNIAHNRALLDRNAQMIAPKSSEALSRSRDKIEALSSILSAHNPQRILDAGFAIVRSKEGSLKSIKNRSKGEIIEITLSDGTIKTEIKDIYGKGKKRA